MLLVAVEVAGVVCFGVVLEVTWLWLVWCDAGAVVVVVVEWCWRWHGGGWCGVP